MVKKKVTLSLYLHFYGVCLKFFAIQELKHKNLKITEINFVLFTLKFQNK